MWPTFRVYRWAVGGYVSPDGPSANPQHPGYCPQGKTTAFCCLYGIPSGLLAWRRFPWSGWVGLCCFLASLFPPALVLTQDTLKPVRDGCRLMLGYPVSRAQKARPRRRFPGGDYLTLIAYHQMAVQTFLDLNPNPGIAGMLSSWK